MSSGFLRLIQSLRIGILAVFVGIGHPILRTSNPAFAQNGQASSQAKTQESRPPATLPPEPLNKKEVAFSRHDDVIPSVAFSPDGKRLASAGNNWVKITDLETGKELLKLKNSRGMSFFSVAYSPDGRTLASGGYDRSIRLWNVNTGKCAATLRGHDAAVRSLAFAPDGRTLASGGGDRAVQLWDLPSRKLRATLLGHRETVRVLAFAPDGRSLASGSDDGTARLWDPAGGPPRELRAEVFCVFHDALTPLRENGRLGGILFQLPPYVVWRAASLERNSTTFATSWGSPRRPNTLRSRARSRISAGTRSVSWVVRM